MPDRSYVLEGVRIFECAAEGTPLRSGRDATDLMSMAWEHRATLVAIPAERLGDDFFRLKTGVAGEIVQKFVNYHLPLAIVGDISRYLDESTALRDFVRESNRGNQVWFVASIDDLDRRVVRGG
jgi:Domain of unknown function (DUF4180)